MTLLGKWVTAPPPCPAVSDSAEVKTTKLYPWEVIAHLGPRRVMAEVWGKFVCRVTQLSVGIQTGHPRVGRRKASSASRRHGREGLWD